MSGVPIRLVAAVGEKLTRNGQNYPSRNGQPTLQGEPLPPAHPNEAAAIVRIADQGTSEIDGFRRNGVGLDKEYCSATWPGSWTWVPRR
jgi:hypothetical protein